MYGKRRSAVPIPAKTAGEAVEAGFKLKDLVEEYIDLAVLIRREPYAQTEENLSRLNYLSLLLSQIGVERTRAQAAVDDTRIQYSEALHQETQEIIESIKNPNLREEVGKPPLPEEKVIGVMKVEREQ